MDGWVQAGEQLAVLVQGRQVDGIFNGEPFSNDGILRMAFMLRIGEHPPHFRISTQVIAFVIPAISIADWVGREEHWAQIVFSPGNVANEQIGSIYFLDFHILFTGKADADLSTVMGVVPKVFLAFECHFFGKTVEQKLPVFLLYTQYDGTSIGIGKCRVAFPKTTGKAATGGFEFDFSRFAFLHQGI